MIEIWVCRGWAPPAMGLERRLAPQEAICASSLVSARATGRSSSPRAESWQAGGFVLDGPPAAVVPSEIMSDVNAQAATVTSLAQARALLSRPTPGVMRAVARRVDELVFSDPPLALEISVLILEALHALPRSQRRATLVFDSWAAYGSACRVNGGFDDAEQALAVASKSITRKDDYRWAQLALRLCYLRAHQGRQSETLALLRVALDHARLVGGMELARRLTTAGTILNRLEKYEEADRYLSEALPMIPFDGARLHVAFVFTLVQARVCKNSATTSEWLAALSFLRGLFAHVEPGSFPEFRIHWQIGNVLRCLRRFEDSLESLERARAGIDVRSNPFDRALLLIDFAELHLDAGNPGRARDLARDSFRVQASIRQDPASYRALRTFCRAAESFELDRSILSERRKSRRSRNWRPLSREESLILELSSTQSFQILAATTWRARLYVSPRIWGIRSARPGRCRRGDPDVAQAQFERSRER